MLYENLKKEVIFVTDDKEVYSAKEVDDAISELLEVFEDCKMNLESEKAKTLELEDEISKLVHEFECY